MAVFGRTLALLLVLLATAAVFAISVMAYRRLVTAPSGALPSAAQRSDSSSSARGSAAAEGTVERDELPAEGSPVSVRLIAVDAFGRDVPSCLSGAVRPDADGRVRVPREPRHEHLLHEEVANQEYWLFAPGYLPTCIPAGTGLQVPIHRVALTEARALRFIMLGLDRGVSCARITAGIRADVRSLDSVEALLAAGAHPAMEVTGPILEVGRVGRYGGRAMFTVLSKDGAPVGPGPSVEFTSEDGDVVVDWSAYAGLFELARLSFELTFDRDACGGDITLELRPSADDVQHRIRFHRDAEEWLLAHADAVPFGSYEVTLKPRRGWRVCLGTIDVEAPQGHSTWHVGRPAILRLTAVGSGAMSVSKARICDAHGRLVATWRRDAAGPPVIEWDRVPPGQYTYQVFGEGCCSAPTAVCLGPGEVAIETPMLEECGKALLVSPEEGSRESTLTRQGDKAAVVRWRDGRNLPLPVGSWTLEMDGSKRTFRVLAGQTTTVRW